MRRYHFAPLERRGLVAGLELSQVLTLVLGSLVALGALRGPGGPAAALGVGSAALALACWPLGGRPPVAWVPIVVRWLLGRRPLRPRGPLPVAPAGIRLVAAPAGPGDEPLGVVRDLRAGTWAAVIPVAGAAFTFLDVGDKERRLAAWGTLLASAARHGSPVHRLQWLEQTEPASPLSTQPEQPDAGPLRAVESYRQLLAQSAEVGSAHRVLLVVAVRPGRRSRQERSFGRGTAGACGLLRREVRLLRGQLRAAEVEPAAALSLPGLAAVLRSSLAGPDGPSAHSEEGVWPLGWRDSWSVARLDGQWRATYWVAEWPRHDVGPDFLAPLLLAEARKTVSVTFAPVPAERAAREAESARTAELADEELRRRAGFLQTARHRRQAQGVLEREAELAEGHAELRFSGYVAVSATSPEGLDAGCAAVESAAQQAGVVLRRLYGRQRDAVDWTLPLGRGLS